MRCDGLLRRSITARLNNYRFCAGREKKDVHPYAHLKTIVHNNHVGFRAEHVILL